MIVGLRRIIKKKRSESETARFLFHNNNNNIDNEATKSFLTKTTKATVTWRKNN